MTPTITLPRATVEQALEAMRCAVPTGKITLYEWAKALSDLDAALAQQAEPWERRVALAEQLQMQQTEPTVPSDCADSHQPAQAEPVAWAHRHSDGTYHDPSVTEHSAGMVPLYPPPPQRKPLTDEEIEDIYLAWDVTPGRRIVGLVRAVERAHGIGGQNDNANS